MTLKTGGSLSKEAFISSQISQYSSVSCMSHSLFANGNREGLHLSMKPGFQPGLGNIEHDIPLCVSHDSRGLM